VTENLKSPGWWSGIGLAVFVSVAAGYVADWFGEAILGFAKSPISAIMMAIVLGMLVANTIKLPDSIQPGLRFCTSAILKIGIILLGIRLSLTGAGQFTLVALPFVIAAIAIGLFTVGLLGRYLGLSRQLSGLIAVGTSICGCTAIVATAPLIRANESEVSYAVACITVFGLAAMFFYPVLAHQTKLVRNLCMIAVIPLVGVLYGTERSKEDSTKINFLAMIPWFIVGFALMSAIRTIGDIGDKPFGLLEPGQWTEIVTFLKESAERCLLVAMAAVGLTSMFAGIIKIGMRPFALGLFAAVLIGGVSFALISLFGADLIALLV